MSWFQPLDTQPQDTTVIRGRTSMGIFIQASHHGDRVSSEKTNRDPLRMPPVVYLYPVPSARQGPSSLGAGRRGRWELSWTPSPAHEPRTGAKGGGKTRTARRQVRVRQRNPNLRTRSPARENRNRDHGKLN
jgi:hypothetical protein